MTIFRSHLELICGVQKVIARASKHTIAKERKKKNRPQIVLIFRETKSSEDFNAAQSIYIAESALLGLGRDVEIINAAYKADHKIRNRPQIKNKDRGDAAC